MYHTIETSKTCSTTMYDTQEVSSSSRSWEKTMA